jgi:membrane protease YdiL (CAAX protease family)
MPVAFLALAMSHRGTRVLLARAEVFRWPSVPVLACVLVVILFAFQYAVAVQFPELVRPIQERQAGLLGSTSVLFLLLLAPLAEELWFRATALRILSESGFPKAGAVCTAIAFAMMHGVVGDWVLTLYYWSVLFALGLILAWVWLTTRRWSDCLWLHYLNNAPALVVVAFGTQPQ